MKITNLFIVIDEESLNTMKGKDGKTAKFESREGANLAASRKLATWTIVHINFRHSFINHTV